MAVTEEARALARRELLRRYAMTSLSAFTLYTKPNYLMGWFHKEVCDKLDKFLNDVIEGRRPRLLICAPPRHGKSELASRRFPAFAMGRYPDLEVIATSYSADLAMAMCRDVQNIIDDELYREVFPEIFLPSKGLEVVDSKKKKRAADKFEIVGHSGGYRAAGVGGGITGMGADIVIVDDPFKNREDANSDTKREKVWDWYTSTLYTRLSPIGGVIVMCTRWHESDLVGKLLEKQHNDDGDSWEVINFPAIAIHDEEYRKEGEALHPERYALPELLNIKRAVGPRDWESLYQQNPFPDGGTIFDANKFKYYKPDELPETFDLVVSSWDMTFKSLESSDFVVGQVWGKKGPNHYLLDQVRQRLDFVSTLAAFQHQAELWPRITARLIEDKANGTAVINVLKDKMSGIIPITPKESKEARAFSVTPMLEAGNIYLPAGEPWVRDVFLPEVKAFPSGKHDDQVDAMTQYLNYISSHGGWGNIAPDNVEALLRGPRMGRIRAYR